MRSFVVGLLALVCGACTSAPVRFFTLTRPASPSDATLPVACCQMQVKVSIPAEVDRPELVRRTGDYEAVILSNDTWLAPLRDEIRGALLTEMNRKVASLAVGESAAPQGFVVLVDVTRFDWMQGADVLVSAGWRIKKRGDTLVAMRCASVARYPAGATVMSSVEGYQQAIRDIADKISLGIFQTLQGAASGCPVD